MCQLSKWRPRAELNPEQVSADALFDVRSTNSLLSVWECPSCDQIDRVALALALNRETIDKIDLLTITDGDIEDLGIGVSHTTGMTPLVGASELHRDLGPLDVPLLSELSLRIAARIREKYHRYTQSRITKLITEALQRNEINVDQVNAKLKPKILALLEDGKPQDQ
jgi:hypothetical protein